MARQTKLVESGPSTALLLARLLSRAGDSKNALTVLRAAVVRYPGDLWTNLELASHLRYTDPPQPDESIRYYTAARALKPETGIELAEVLQKQKRVARGTSSSSRSPGSIRCRHAPFSTFTCCCETVARWRKRDPSPERMIAPFREQVKRDPNDALAHWRIAVLASVTVDFSSAVAACREAARIDPKDVESRGRLAELLLFQRRSARRHRRIPRRDPDRPNAHK